MQLPQEFARVVDSNASGVEESVLRAIVPQILKVVPRLPFPSLTGSDGRGNRNGRDAANSLNPGGGDLAEQAIRIVLDGADNHGNAHHCREGGQETRDVWGNTHACSLTRFYGEAA